MGGLCARQPILQPQKVRPELPLERQHGGNARGEFLFEQGGQRLFIVFPAALFALTEDGRSAHVHIQPDQRPFPVPDRTQAAAAVGQRQGQRPPVAVFDRQLAETGRASQ